MAERNHTDKNGKSDKERKPKVLLLHRRGREMNLRREFDDEKSALAYAKEHKLMIVHSEKDEQGNPIKLHYLPE